MCYTKWLSAILTVICVIPQIQYMCMGFVVYCGFTLAENQLREL